MSGRVAWAPQPQTPTCLPTPRGCFCDLLGKGSQAPWLGQGPSSPTALPPPHPPGPLVTSALPNRPYARQGMAHPPAPAQSPGGAAEWGGGAGWARASGGWVWSCSPHGMNKCSKVHNTCYFHKGTHPCNYHPDQETHLSAPQKCPNLKSLGDLSTSVDPALPPRLPLQPAKPQISHLDAKGLNQDRKFFPPLCQRVKGTGESVAGKYSWRRWHSLGRPWKVSSVRAGRQRLRGAGSCTNIHPRRHERHLLILSVNS